MKTTPQRKKMFSDFGLEGKVPNFCVYATKEWSKHKILYLSKYNIPLPFKKSGSRNSTVRILIHSSHIDNYTQVQ